MGYYYSGSAKFPLFPVVEIPLFFLVVLFQLWPSDHTQTVMRNSNVVCPVRDAARGEGASQRKRKRKRRKGDGGHLVIRADPRNRPLGSRQRRRGRRWSSILFDKTRPLSVSVDDSTIVFTLASFRLITRKVTLSNISPSRFLL